MKMKPGKIVRREAVVDAQTGTLIEWLLQSGEAGPAQQLAQYKEKTVQIVGDLVEGDLEGSNDVNATSPTNGEQWDVLLDDETQQPLTKKGLYHVKLNPLWIRPVNRKSNGPVRFIVVATK